MEYKGHYIIDECWHNTSELIEGFGNDERYWYASKEDLEALLKRVDEKTAKLNSSDIIWKDLRICFCGIEEDDYIDASFTCEFEWKELETAEEKRIRISEAKKAIDNIVAIDEQVKKEIGDKMIENEIAHLRSLGYKVTK